MKGMDSIRSYSEITRALVRERAGCDRHPHALSAVVFATASPELVGALLRRVRQTDEVGWFGERSLCAVLPYTSSDGARKFADNIVRGLTAPPDFKIYSYPAEWPREGSVDGSHQVFHLEELIDVPMSRWKRAMDISVSIIGLLLLSPLLIVIAGIVKLSSPGPALLCQKRVGRRGRNFTLWKFRTMHVNADEEVHEDYLKHLIASDRPMAKLDVGADPRIFPAGKVIRRCYLDELPQLINVLSGEMSLVGPRPCLPYEAAKYDLWHTGRFKALPGMTGLWQVSGKNKTTFAEMIRYDIAYAQRPSFGQDIKILLRTLPSIVAEMSDRLAERRGEHRRPLDARPIRKNT